MKYELVIFTYCHSKVFFFINGFVQQGCIKWIWFIKESWKNVSWFLQNNIKQQ